MRAHRHTAGRDLYAVLGAPPAASADELRRAYRALVLAHHPDLARPEERAHAEERTKQINAAARVLLDPAARARYDLHRATTTAAPRGPAATWPEPRRARSAPAAPVEAAEPAPVAPGLAHRVTSMAGHPWLLFVVAAAFVLFARYVTTPSERVARGAPAVAASAAGSWTEPASPSSLAARPRAPSWRPSAWPRSRTTGARRAVPQRPRGASGPARHAAVAVAARPTEADRPPGHATVRWPVIEQAIRETAANDNGPD